MFMDVEYMKGKFPNYKVINLSNKTSDEISDIIEKTSNEKNLIKFIERKSKNEEYFKYVQSVHTKKIENFKYLIIEKNTHAISKEKNYDSRILHLQRTFNNENNCPICFEEDLREYVYCQKCATVCCLSCMDKLENIGPVCCSVCRHESFNIRRYQ